MANNEADSLAMRMETWRKALGDRRTTLWEDPPLFDPLIGQDPPSVVPYLLGSEARGAVVVCAGGGYAMKAEHEGPVIARFLNDSGVNAIVVDYRVAPYRHPAPLFDAQRAIRLTRYHAKDWGVDPGKIGILGFSAGGHLAATAGTLFDCGEKDAQDPVDRLSCRPDAMILCYPVITSGPFGHRGSFDNLLGAEATKAERANYSAELNVTENTPPAFIWHTAQDAGVPVENSYLFAAALARYGIPVEMHIFPYGAHGLGLAQDEPGACQWPGLMANWLQNMGWAGEQK